MTKNPVITHPSRQSLLPEQNSLVIASGQVMAFFAFDIGYEINLNTARELLPSAPRQPLTRKKQTPNYLQYPNPPQVVQWATTDTLLGIAGHITITLFDFGAISIMYRWALPSELPLADLPKLSQLLSQRNLEADARVQLQIIFERMTPAIIRPSIASLVEDYYIFVIERFTTALQAEQLLQQQGILAQVLRFETQPLSKEQQLEALSQHISYYEQDLVLVDWNAAIIYDQDFDDTLAILELINVELLEARYIDAQLDLSIKNYETLRYKRREWHLLLRAPYRKDIEDLAELRIESALLGERVDNALKLIGDDYLARVHTAATQRFYLQEWDAAISRKLNIMEDLYQLLTDRVHSAQGHVLELIVIFLIVLELITAIISLRH